MLLPHYSQRGCSRPRANESRFTTRSDSRLRHCCCPSSYFRSISPQSSGANAAHHYREGGGMRCRCCMPRSFCLQSAASSTLTVELLTHTSREQREPSSSTIITLQFVSTGRRSRSKTIHTRTNYLRL